ncbi:MAG: dTDP-4-dehydrorhamnose reductase [Nitrospirae bacterium]|nr:dTDP-4-dehydrorhamnose reductase [Nitrospirota bacterium]
MIKVLLSGSKGMLAHAFLKKKPNDWSILATDIEELDIRNRVQVHKTVGDYGPNLIINCAAFTRVDDCETERELAFSINAKGAGTMAESAREIEAKLVHFSTDYIFDGTKKSPYLEDDPPNPISVYGSSKLAGERNVRNASENHLLIRTQWLYGDGGNHFVKTILNLAKERDSIKVVNDQFGSPTWTEDLVDATIALIHKESIGTYHVVNSGECSWYDFAREIVKEAGLSTKVIPCSTAEFPRPAKRPSYSVLSVDKTSNVLGQVIPGWKDSLRTMVRG